MQLCCKCKKFQGFITFLLVFDSLTALVIFHNELNTFSSFVLGYDAAFGKFGITLFLLLFY